MSERVYDKAGLNVVSIARPGGPRLSFVLTGTDAVLDADQVAELALAIGDWLKLAGIWQADASSPPPAPQAKRARKAPSSTAKGGACPFCGHTAQHMPGTGCLHQDGKGRFCSCKESP